MIISLIGCGCGPDTLTAEARRAMEEAQLLLGSERLLREYAPDGAAWERAVRAEEIADRLRTCGCERACVLLSGDSGFFSGARTLLPLLEGEDLRLIPGISSLQLFAARLQRPWQDWRLFSAHGRECDAVAAVCGEGPAFFLTGGRLSPADLCAQLSAAGLDDLPVTVGERLGSPEEQLYKGTAGAFCGRAFDPLSVMLAEAAPQPVKQLHGLPDSLFLREEKIPMTKQEIRAAALSLLALTPEDICWDIGAGTGSVGIEMALQTRAVYGVERKAEALALAEKNRQALGAWKLRLVPGTAPEALAGLPAPDAVFVGGSGGELEQILRCTHEANPRARVCVSAIAVETLHTALHTLETMGYETEVCQIAVSRSRSVAGLHLMLAQNPVWLVTGRAK